MKKMLLAMTVVLLLGGCALRKNSDDRRVVRGGSVPADEQIVTEAIASGAVINPGYTISVSDADVKAKPDDVLYDVSGEPYRVVKHIGLSDEP